MGRIRRALISVSDKTGVVAFAEGLASLGVEIISTGGTSKLLRSQRIQVRDVADVTGFPEMLDGRVKTLHPRVHGGILAVRAKPEHQSQVAEHGIEFIDLVAVNLYPFEQTAAKPGVDFEEIIENIDIGGPSMIRSAAKNFEDVVVVVEAADYVPVLEELRQNAGSITRETRAHLARKAFATTSAYDGAISRTLQHWEAGRPGTSDWLPETLHRNFRKTADLRYGENPHQKAALYRDPTTSGRGLAYAAQLQGKELSYNNWVDLEAAWRLASEFVEPVTAIVKHTNPCGIASATTLSESYERALAVDSVSAFGSVIAFNRRVDAATAELVHKLFVEAIVAPGFEAEALERFSAKKNLRLVDMSTTAGDDYGLQIKSIGGGLLVQTPDNLEIKTWEWETVTERQPSESERLSLEFAWRVVKHVKSNAIVYARERAVVGVGAGQMSRVDAARVAALKANLAWP